MNRITAQAALSARMLSAFMAAAVLACTFLSPAFAQSSNGIVVELNKGQMVRLDGNASVVAVADPEIADVEVLAPNLVSVQGRGVGQTSLIAFNEIGDEILNETVTVNHNTGKLQSIIHRVMPDANVHFDSVDGALVMSGDVASPIEADRLTKLIQPLLGDDALVNMLNVKGSDQVMLRVRVAEVSRSELKRFGINLASIISQGGQFAFAVASGRDITPNAAGLISRGDGNNNIGVSLNSGDVDLNGVIDALATDNLVKILAEPSLTTASGRSASFLAGGEFPIPVPGQDGQVTIEYRQYGVALRFTPQVLSKEKISLTVAPEVSQLTDIGSVEFAGFTVPALTTRRAETTVELGSGQSFAVAGLLQNNNSNDVSKFPGLGDIPILGALFRSTEFQNDQSELVIVVTPYIVRGVTANQIKDPTEGYIPPTDPERILEGNTYTPEKPAPGTFMLEGSPSDMRKPKYRRALAEQAGGHKIVPEESMTPAPPVAKTTPADKAAVTPVQVQDIPSRSVAPMPAPTPAPPAPVAPAAPPASLNGPVGYMLR